MQSVIINGFENDIAEKLITNNPFSKCFYIGEKELIYLANENTFVYDCYALPLGHYPDDFFETEPLDEPIIKKFSECETVVLKMFERNDFWFDASYNQRKEWYLMHLRYWYHIVHTYNVVCYIGSNFAHEVYDYVIAEIVKEKGGKLFFFTQLSFMDRFILETDFYNYTRLKKYLNTQKNDIKIEKNVKEYIDSIRYATPADFKIPFYMKIVESRGVVKNQHKIIKVYNRKYVKEADYTKKFIYVALHYQPEMTTCPMAGEYVNQDLMIELLDFYLPKDIYIYVKEHPKQTVVCRSEKFYKKFYQRKRIRFINASENSMRLVDNALFVVTCTGTVGYEALFRSKPVIIFGNSFYQFAPGCFSVKSKKELQNVLRIILSGYTVNENDIDLFFQKIYNFSYYGCVDIGWINQVDISAIDNYNVIFSIVQKEIFLNFI